MSKRESVWLKIAIEIAIKLGGKFEFQTEEYKNVLNEMLVKYNKQHIKKPEEAIRDTLNRHNPNSSRFNGNAIFENLSSGEWGIKEEYLQKINNKRTSFKDYVNNLEQEKITWTHVIIKMAKKMGGEVNFKAQNYENILNEAINDLGYEPKRDRLIENSQVSFSDNSSYLYGLDIFEREKGKGIYRLKNEFINKSIEQIIEIAKVKKHNIVIEELEEDFNFQNAIQERQLKNKGKKIKKPKVPDVAESIENKTENKSKIKYPRNPDNALYVQQEANYSCEISEKHKTFKRESDGTQYMESHHIVPMAMQHDAKKHNKRIVLDRVENIVCLCPNCHRQIHHGDIKEKEKIAKKLIKLKGETLGNKIFIKSENDLIKMAMGENIFKK